MSVLSCPFSEQSQMVIHGLNLHQFPVRTTENAPPSLTSRKFANMAWQWSDLIKERAPISAALSEAAVEISAFEDQILLDALSRNTSGERVSKGAALPSFKTVEEAVEAAKSRPEAEKMRPFISNSNSTSLSDNEN